MFNGNFLKFHDPHKIVKGDREQQLLSQGKILNLCAKVVLVSCKTVY